MIRFSRTLLAALLLVAACRGKEHGTSAPGSNATAFGSNKASSGFSWVAYIYNREDAAGLLSLASGGGHTYVVVPRVRDAAVTVNGDQALPSAKTTHGALVILDAAGKLTGATNIEPESEEYPGLFADAQGALLAVGFRLADDGRSLWSYQAAGTPAKPIDIPGSATGIARTASGTIWTVGQGWAKGKGCDGTGFVARGTATGAFEAVACNDLWSNLHVAAAGEDAVVCGSTPNESVSLLGTEIPARTFVARIGADKKLKWIKAANELGDSSCKGVVVTSDGDVVLAGAGAEGFDLTEDAIKKGVKAKPDDKDAVGDIGFLERFGPDGVRRWGYAIGRFGRNDHTGLTADANGNAIIADWFPEPLQLGGGPVGPKASLVASIDRDAKVTGMVVVEGGAFDLYAATDGAGGLVIGFPATHPAKIQEVTVNAKKGDTAVVRIPLPLPPPPK